MKTITVFHSGSLIDEYDPPAVTGQVALWPIGSLAYNKDQGRWWLWDGVVGHFLSDDQVPDWAKTIILLLI